MNRTIICDDAMNYLKHHKDVGAIVTGLPDMAEMGLTDEHYYKDWFENAIQACLESVSAKCPAVFCQTDRKANGGVISKATLMMNAATRAGKRLLWHKIVVRRDIGKVDLLRPGYSHWMAFGDEFCKPGKATPDLIPLGYSLYPNGMGMEVCEKSLEFVKKATNKVLDPFCGRGTTIILAEKLGMDAIGVDLDPKQVELAKLADLSNVNAAVVNQQFKKFFTQ